MSSEPTQELIIIDGRSIPISELTEFGFVAPLGLPDGETRSEGVLVLGEKQLDVEFRVRREVRGESSCSFANFAISSSEVLRKHLRDRERVSSGNEELEARSYDELASGVVTAQPATSQAAADPRQKGYVKSFAMLAMLFTMIALAILAAVFLRSKSTLSVGNSALVGNSIAVNSKVEGEIVDILVGTGDKVRKGDLMIRLSNPEIIQANQQLEAQLKTAKAKTRSLIKQRETFAAKLKFASRKLELDREVAKSELEAAMKGRKSADAAFGRLKPFVKSGAITQLELDEVENKLMAEESNCIAKENLVRQIDFSLEAAKSNVLIIGDRIDDGLGRIEADLEMAQAEVVELAQVLEQAVQRERELNILAPRDGTVYVNYRQMGEFIKVADEVVGLSYPGETWAAGQVSSGQASRVLPGQPVKIRIPSMGVSIDGTVMAVGHRAMYSKGNYNADFRGATATDVPVKVYIEDLPNDIPSGIRLDMAINTGFGVEWLDKTMGYELNVLGSSSRLGGPVKQDDSSKITLASKKTLIQETE